MVDLAEERWLLRTDRTGYAGRRSEAGDGGDSGPLPDFTGLDLAELRALVDHPVLGAVLATLLHRGQAADGGLVAYHEDTPRVER